MKKAFLSIVVAFLALCSCTQYNGHIGPIFGSWALEQICEDGTPLPPQEAATVFSFQNEVIQVAHLVDPPFTPDYRYGNFEVTDKELILKFQAYPTPDNSELYMTPYWLYFPEDGLPIHFDIRTLNSSLMELELNNEGTKYIYKFRKTW